MSERSIEIVAAFVALVAFALGVAVIFSTSQTDSRVIGLALIATLLAHQVAPAVSSGNRLSLSVAVAASLPFVLQTPDRVDLTTVIGIYLASAVMIAGRDWLKTSQPSLSLASAFRRFLGESLFAVVFALVRDFVGRSLGESGWEILIPFLCGAAAWLVLELAGWALVASSPTTSFRYLALAGLKDINVFVSLVATGGLFGLMFEALDWWALPVALLPYSFAHGAFRRFHETKTTYRQTIRALARIPEIAGLNLAGHADRTAQMAVAIAKDLGLRPEEVDDVEFAALMHDIGHITLNEPTVVEQGWTDEDLARWGAEIIAGAASLNTVAGYVRRQYEPYRKPGEESDPDVPVISRIVKIASAYDTSRSGSGMSSLQSLEDLHQGAAYEYDPEVVASLRRVVEPRN